jgi:putative DNA primase/helicase
MDVHTLPPVTQEGPGELPGLGAQGIQAPLQQGQPGPLQHPGNLGLEQLKDPKMAKAISVFLNMEDLAERIYHYHPYFYDKAGLFWLWDKYHYRWDVVDDTDILNMIKANSTANTVKSKDRQEILESMKQFGRTKIPEPIRTTWIQFKGQIVDIMTGERFHAEPKYFVTNPIPWDLHKENFENTPNMDRIFEEWVGKENIKLLYEILAYCLLPDYPLNRIFCFVGSGMNGKSKYLELLRKFVGDPNCASTELDTLITSRFEVTRLHRKLVCQMGETDFGELTKTSMLKKLTGGDLIGYEYKNKTPFEDKNYAKIIISTNNLPTTSDKTIGFYRRWCIIDFPNMFSEKKDILNDIPDEEYNCLSLKVISYLKELLERRNFTNEGTIEERKEKYESKSNFLEQFIRLSTEEDMDSYITKAEFFRRFSAWGKENRHREMSETSIGIAMKKMGIESSTKHLDWLHDGAGGNARVWLGIKWKI